MPELPEVETIVRELKKELPAHKITGIKNHYSPIIKSDVNLLKKKVIGHKIIKINRHGKYIFLLIDNNYTVVIHLRMTGQLFWAAKEAPIDKHTHLEFFFANKKKKLLYRDIRKFGGFTLLTEKEYTEYIKNKKIAEDALKISLPEFKKNLCRKKGVIKAVLLDQSIIAGLGNIYVDEVLIREKLSPHFDSQKLTEDQVSSLLKTIKQVLKAAILKKGTTFSDYITANGKKGEFQLKLKAYQQQGKPCCHCGTLIEKTKVAGRGTHFCPNCQK